MLSSEQAKMIVLQPAKEESKDPAEALPPSVNAIGYAEAEDPAEPVVYFEAQEAKKIMQYVHIYGECGAKVYALHKLQLEQEAPDGPSKCCEVEEPEAPYNLEDDGVAPGDSDDEAKDEVEYGVNGYDVDGYDVDGYNVAGYDRAGCDIHGYTKEFYDRCEADDAAYNEYMASSIHREYRRLAWEREARAHELAMVRASRPVYASVEEQLEAELEAQFEEWLEAYYESRYHDR
jgi:hypothetical protein